MRKIKQQARLEKKKTVKERKEKVGLITKKHLDELSNVESIEEFYHITELLKDKDFEKFIKHYKEKAIKKENKVADIIRKAKDKKELIELLKQNIITYLKDKKIELEHAISEKRKKGKDMYIQELQIMAIPLKIKVYEATLQRKDFLRLKHIIDTIEKSLNQNDNG